MRETKAKNDYERIIMNDNLINNNIKLYDKIFDALKKEISSKDFRECLKEAQRIDSNHYNEKITIEEMIEYLEQYKKYKHSRDRVGKAMILQRGNPEIIFQICLEILRSDFIEITLVIQDFCVGQSTFIVESINEIFKQNKLNKKITISNLLSDEQIVEKSKDYNTVISVGDSNLYNRLENEIPNLELNSYGIFEVYSDSEEFEELEETFFEYCYQKEFEAENYGDSKFNDAIRLINKNGYNFASILFSKDEEEQKEFKEKINSKYVIINKNSFKEIKFRL